MNPELRDKIKATLEGRSYSSSFLGGDTISSPENFTFLPGYRPTSEAPFTQIARKFLPEDQFNIYQSKIAQPLSKVRDFLAPSLTTQYTSTLAEKPDSTMSELEVGVRQKEAELGMVRGPGGTLIDPFDLGPIGGATKKVASGVTDYARGVFRKLLGKEGVQKIANEVDEDVIRFTLRKTGASQVANDPEIVTRLVRATNESQVNRIIDDAEQQFARDAELAARVQQRVTQPATRDAAQTTARATTPVDMTRATTRTAPQPTAVEPAAIINPAKTKQDIRTKVKETLEQEQLVKDQVLPKVERPREITNLTQEGRDTVAFTIDTMRNGDKLVPKNIENNFRTIAGSLGLNTDKKLSALVNDFAELLNQYPDVAKQIEAPENFFWEQVSVPADYLRNNPQAGFARLFGDRDGARRVRQTSAARDVVNKINKSSTIDELVTGPDATPKKGQADAGQVSLAASRPNPKGQGVELPPKTSQNSEILDSLNKSNPEQAKKASQEYTAFKEAFDKEINSNWSKIREKFQDSFIAVRKLQQQVANGGKIPDDINIDQAETLFHGRVHTKLEEVKDEITVIDRSITDTAKKFNVSADEMRTDIDSYLHALHAPERNAKLGDGAAGITNKEAQATMDALKKTGRYNEIKAEAEKLLDLNRRTLDILKDAEMIDQKTYNLLKETYKNHIPLQRVVDDTEDLAQFLSGKGFDVKSTGLKRAKGSDKPVADITTNIATNVQQAIIRSEKNLVNLTTLRWARANKDLGIIKEIKPKAIGKSFDDEGVILENLSDKPNIISLREKGKPVYLEVQDARLAVVLKGVNVEQVPSLLKGVTFLTRLYGQLHTRFNYEFAFRNNIRDIQEMAVDVASREGMGFGAAGKSVARDVQSKAAITDFLFGRDTEGARLYKQMKEDGGTTGGMGLSTRAQIEVDINNIRKLNQSKPRQAALAAIKLVDKWNTLFEDASRLSVYRTALDNGLSRKQAAVLAKESTINFNKKGTAGPLLNGLYMFSNASIQGTTKIMRAMKNPRVAAATTATIGSAVYAANEWNDTVDPDWRDKVTKYDRTSNLVIMLPSTDQSVNYITVPVSWGLKPIKMTMEYMHDLSKGKVDVVDGAQGILLSVAQSYNPLAGDESLLRTLTPTVLKTPFEIASNRGWHGSRIKPDYDINAPASSQYFPSLSDSVSGQFFINATELLSNKGVIEISPADAEYAFRQYIGGVGRSIDKLVTTVSKVGKGEEVPANQRPILSSFFKTRDQEQVYNDLFYSRREQADKEKSRERILDKRRVQPIYEEVQLLIDSGQTDKAQAIVDNLSEEDYEVYKKLKATDARRANVGAQIEQYDTVRRVEELIQEGKRDEALRIVEQLSDEEYKAYKDAKSALGVEF